MNSLPVEVVELIADYLPLKDAKAFSETCKLCYAGSQIKIWQYPKIYSSGVYTSDIKHLPIKRIADIDLLDSSFRLEDLPITLREIYMYDLTIDKLLKFRDSDIKICIYPEYLWGNRLTNAFLRSFSNIRFDAGLTSSPGLQLHNLAHLSEFRFTKFCCSQLVELWDGDKTQLLDFLISSDIEKILLDALWCYQFAESIYFKFNISDIRSLRSRNIVLLSTQVLETDENWHHPWPVLREIKTLKIISFEPCSIISLWNLRKLSFFAIKIDDRPRIVVRDLVKVYETLVRTILLKHVFHGPEWIFQIYNYLTIFLE